MEKCEWCKRTFNEEVLIARYSKYYCEECYDYYLLELEHSWRTTEDDLDKI